MREPYQPPYQQQPYGQQQPYAQPQPYQQPYQQPYGAAAYSGQYPQAPPGYGYPPSGPIGQVRSTGTCILLAIVTLGFYSWYWFFQTHEEMKRHSGDGLGGGIALLLTILVGVVMPYLTSSEVGKLYQRRGQHAPVSGATRLWYFPGIFIIVGPIVWFVQTNGALNAYWRSLGAAG